MLSGQRLSQGTPWLDTRESGGDLLCSVSKGSLRTKWLWLYLIWRETSQLQLPSLDPADHIKVLTLSMAAGLSSALDLKALFHKG